MAQKRRELAFEWDMLSFQIQLFHLLAVSDPGEGIKAV